MAERGFRGGDPRSDRDCAGRRCACGFGVAQLAMGQRHVQPSTRMRWVPAHDGPKLFDRRCGASFAQHHHAEVMPRFDVAWMSGQERFEVALRRRPIAVYRRRGSSLVGDRRRHIMRLKRECP